MPTNGLSFASICFQRLIFQLELVWVPKTSYSMRASVTGEGGGRKDVALERVEGLHFASSLACADRAHPPPQAGGVQEGSSARRGWELLKVPQRNRLQVAGGEAGHHVWRAGVLTRARPLSGALKLKSKQHESTLYYS